MADAAGSSSVTTLNLTTKKSNITLMEYVDWDRVPPITMDIVYARWGNDDTWLDVTSIMKQNSHHEWQISWQNLGDPLPGCHKVLQLTLGNKEETCDSVTTWINCLESAEQSDYRTVQPQRLVDGISSDEVRMEVRP